MAVGGGGGRGEGGGRESVLGNKFKHPLLRIMLYFPSRRVIFIPSLFSRPFILGVNT